jgi:hypothetical protein
MFDSVRSLSRLEIKKMERKPRPMKERPRRQKVLAERTAAVSESAAITPSDQSEPSKTSAPADGILAIGNEARNQGKTDIGELLPDLISATLGCGETAAEVEAESEAEAEGMPRQLESVPSSADDAVLELEGKAEFSVEAETTAMQAIKSQRCRAPVLAD